MLERKKKHMIKVRLKILYILIYFTVIFLEKNVKMLKKKKKHVIKVSLVIMFYFSSRSPFAPLNQGPSQVMQPDCYSQELIVVSESSITERVQFVFQLAAHFSL